MGDIGQEKICAFCTDCGSRIHHALGVEPYTISARGALDDVCRIASVAHIWTRRAQPWLLQFIGDECCYETELDDFDGLVVCYQRKSI